MNLKQRDKKHLWHPLRQHQLEPESIAITKAKGCVLTDENGNEYIDAISSWYTSIFGHCNSYIIEKAYQQMQQLDQIMFSDFTHEPAITLSEKLIKILPEGQNRIFFNDNGSTAVEAALKMAIQYYYNQGETKTVFIALENGFHGDTFGAMSVSGLSIYNGPFEKLALQVKRIPVPNQNNIAKINVLLKKYASQNNIAGFIYEPLVQGAAGMKMYSATALNQILQTCKNLNILTIADEVMTGFGKTGKNFASNFITTKPDIICLSKALTAGLLPMAITSCSEKIYTQFLSNEIAKGFFHCHTYSANPIACATAIASIDLLASQKTQKNISAIATAITAFNAKIKNHKKVKETRHIGVIFAIELAISSQFYGALRSKLSQFFIANGVFLRPLGNTIYIQVPYIIKEKQLQKIFRVIEEALEIV